MPRTERSEIKNYPVYAPRVLAGNGTHILDVTTRDRTFMIEMVRQTKDERGEQFRMKTVKPEAAALKGRLEAWVTANRAEIARVYEDEKFEHLEQFRDRTIDITRPLEWEGHGPVQFPPPGGWDPPSKRLPPWR